MKQKSILQRECIELTGVLHIHTSDSFDCQIPLSKALKAAKSLHLDYIGLNNHFTLSDLTKTIIPPGLIVLNGIEINDPKQNHHLLIYNNSAILSGKEVSEYSTYYQQAGAVTFVAHPFEKRATKAYRTYPWLDTDCNQYDGVEIWNFMSSLLKHLSPKKNGILYLIAPFLLVHRPYPQCIQFWNNQWEKGFNKSAIGSLDVHGVRLRLFGIPITFLAHRALYHFIRTNVLLPKGVPINQDSILGALKRGNSYLCNHWLGIPYNFYAGVCLDSQAGILFGEEAAWQPGMKFYFNLPFNARVDLYRNGKRIDRIRAKQGFFNIFEAGWYRLQITRFSYVWIITNHINLI